MGISLAMSLSGVETTSAAPALRYRTDRILVQTRLAMSAGWAQFQRAEGLRLRRDFPLLGGIQVLEVPVGVEVTRLVERLRASGLVEAVDLDHIVHVAATPDDPALLGGLQWGLYNNGTSGGVLGADIHALEAWDTRNSASNIIVAVVDSGACYTHQDLAANMWVNPGEIPGNNLDDDHNGVKDDIHGINAVGTGPTSGDPWDDYGHGTAVAGVIGGVGNNGVGVSGVAWQVRIMALKFFNAAGDGSYSDAVECLNYARANGARIINTSFVDTVYNSVLYNAMLACRNAGIIIVAAAGNDTINIDVTRYYPASFNLDNIVSVAASTRTDTLASFSNYGATNVDLVAPGKDIYLVATNSDSSYRWDSGTSFAAPQVAGALALALAQFPTNTYRQIIDRLLVAADRLPALTGKCVTGGRLNLAKLVAPWPPTLERLAGGATNTIRLRLRGEPWIGYALESSTSLTNWASVITNVTGADGMTIFSQTNAGIQVGLFYRTKRID